MPGGKSKLTVNPQFLRSSFAVGEDSPGGQSGKTDVQKQEVTQTDPETIVIPQDNNNNNNKNEVTGQPTTKKDSGGCCIIS